MQTRRNQKSSRAQNTTGALYARWGNITSLNAKKAWAWTGTQRPLKSSNQTPTDDTSMTYITLAMYNVVSARKTHLLLALRTMADINTDIAVLMETKLTSGRHAKTEHGYLVFASLVTSPSQGGVALIWQKETTHWTLEGMRVLSANSISATLVSGDQCWLLLGT